MTLPLWHQLFMDLDRKARAGTAPQKVYVTAEDYAALRASWYQPYDAREAWAEGDQVVGLLGSHLASANEALKRRDLKISEPFPPEPPGMLNGIPIEVVRNASNRPEPGTITR